MRWLVERDIQKTAVLTYLTIILAPPLSAPRLRSSTTAGGLVRAVKNMTTGTEGILKQDLHLVRAIKTAPLAPAGI